MKRLVLVLLMMILMAALVGCAGKDDTAVQSKTPTQQAGRDSAQAGTEETVSGDAAVPLDAAVLSQDPE